MANYITVASEKDKRVAFYLCLFGGFLGLHRFYVGKIGTGILYLFTFGGYIVGWLVDLINIAAGGFLDNAGAPLRVKGKQKELFVSNSPIVNNISYADEILKYKNLLDIGAISKEEYDIFKEKLINQ